MLEGDQLQPYMDAIELEGNAAQPMEEAGVEEEKASRTITPRAFELCVKRVHVVLVVFDYCRVTSFFFSVFNCRYVGVYEGETSKLLWRGHM